MSEYRLLKPGAFVFNPWPRWEVRTTVDNGDGTFTLYIDSFPTRALARAFDGQAAHRAARRG